MSNMKEKYLYLIIATILPAVLLFSACADNIEGTVSAEVTSTPTATIQPEDQETPEPEAEQEDMTENTEAESSSDWTKSTHSNDVGPNYDIVFDQSKVLEFNIVIDSEDWQAMLDDARTSSSTQKNKNNQVAATAADSDNFWVTSTITFNDITWDYVGIRLKGNSSLKSVINSDNSKYSFKLDFDEFEDEYPEIDNQRFYGFKQLNLNNNYSDSSLMHDKVAADLFREFGLASAQTAFCIVNVDYGEGSQFFGVYTLVEEMDDTGIEYFFGSDSGNLYKPEGRGANFSEGSYNDEDMEKKNNEEEADYSDVRALYETINSEKRKTDYDSWKSDLENIFNTDGFLKWLAANTVIQNWDTYGNTQHNYYLYNDPETGQLNWIPWDNNEAFNSGKKDRDALGLDMSEVSTQWPLIRYLLDDEEYRVVYEGYLKQFVDEVFIPDEMIAAYNGYYELIKEYAYAEREESTFIRSDEAFDSAVEELKAHVLRRNEAVQDYLNQ